MLPTRNRAVNAFRNDLLRRVDNDRRKNVRDDARLFGMNVRLKPACKSHSNLSQSTPFIINVLTLRVVVQDDRIRPRVPVWGDNRRLSLVVCCPPPIVFEKVM